MIKSGALHIIESLVNCGHRALLAGGCVRDWIMGCEPKDWDTATDADPEAVQRIFERTVPVGVQFGVVRVLLDDGEYEVARFRRDGPYLDGRHPNGVEFVDEEADAARRDFTINGLFYDPLAGDIIDYVGGERDIDRGLVRAIGRPDDRFAEDHLRMLRAVRFAARLGFQIDPDTFVAIREGSEQIVQTSIERVRDEMTLILTEGGAVQGVQQLLNSGLLQHILPEVVAMKGVPQPLQFHPEGDLWNHLMLILEGLKKPSSTLAWGALLHDIGKPATLTVEDRIRFNRHDAVGAEMAEGICRRLRMSNDETEQITHLTAQHMRVGRAAEMRESKLKRMLRQPFFPELLELHRIDCLASHGKLDMYEFCKERLVEHPDELGPERLVTGDDLIALGYLPGPRFKEILETVEDEQLEGRLDDRQQALEFVRRRFPI